MAAPFDVYSYCVAPGPNPQGPAKDAGALGYKGFGPTLRKGWGTRKGKSRRPPGRRRYEKNRAQPRVAVPLLALFVGRSPFGDSFRGAAVAVGAACGSGGLMQRKFLVQGEHCALHGARLYHQRYVVLRRALGDGDDADAFASQRGEGAPGDAGYAVHVLANDGDNGDVGFGGDVLDRLLIAFVRKGVAQGCPSGLF